MTRRNRPMRPYRVSDLPVTCADCGKPLRYDPDRYAFVHIERGADHAPHVAGTVQR